jgi:hypothetical protein
LLGELAQFSRADILISLAGLALIVLALYIKFAGKLAAAQVEKVE